MWRVSLVVEKTRFYFEIVLLKCVYFMCCFARYSILMRPWRLLPHIILFFSIGSTLQNALFPSMCSEAMEGTQPHCHRWPLLLHTACFTFSFGDCKAKMLVTNNHVAGSLSNEVALIFWLKDFEPAGAARRAGDVKIFAHLTSDPPVSSLSTSQSWNQCPWMNTVATASFHARIKQKDRGK